MMDEKPVKRTVQTACAFAGTSQAQVADAMKTSRQNFSRRLETGRFTPEELGEIARILGAEYVYYFQFPDGTKI